MLDLDRFWAEGDSFAQSPPLDDETLATCEAGLGVRFPATLVELYQRQNGGAVRDADVSLFSLQASGTDALQRIAPLSVMLGDDDFLAELIADELGDPTNVLLLAGDDGHTWTALDFNTHGPQGEPRVVWVDLECSECGEVAATFDDYVRGLMAADDEPAVDRGEIGRLSIVAEETIDVDYGGGERWIEQQTLCETDDAFVLFCRQRNSEGEEHSRCRLVKPIDADQCVIHDYRPEPHRTYHILLQPAEAEIEWTYSRKTSQGRWKNSQSEGVPIYAEFESHDRGRLEELRRTILGGEPSPRALAEERWREHVGQMSDEQLEALTPHMMAHSMEVLERLHAETDLGEPPEEIKPLWDRMEQMKAKMKADLQQRMRHAGELDPELADLMKQMTDPPDTDV